MVSKARPCALGSRAERVEEWAKGEECPWVQGRGLGEPGDLSSLKKIYLLSQSQTVANELVTTGTQDK